jgi:hypothetical protein
VIKRAAIEVRLDERNSAKLRRKQRTQLPVLPLVVIVLVGALSFFVGARLHKWMPHRIMIVKNDSAVVTILPSSTGSTVLIVTPDHHAVIVTSDFAPTSIGLLQQSITNDHLTKIYAIVLTSVTSNTADGLVDFSQVEPFKGPIVTPYEDKEPPEWWERTEQNFVSKMQSHGLATISWKDSAAILQKSIPRLQINIFPAQRSKWQVPATFAKIQYQQGSVLDLTSLTSQQVAAITGQPIGISRILLVNGADQFVSKELLAEVQPDVVLTGPADIPPGDRAEDNVRAADAEAISLASEKSVGLLLPASDSQDVLTKVR